MEKQHTFAITSQKLDRQAKTRAGDADAVAYMELLPPAYLPGPWEVLSWKYDPQAAGWIHVVWRHG